MRSTHGWCSNLQCLSWHFRRRSPEVCKVARRAPSRSFENLQKLPDNQNSDMRGKPTRTFHSAARATRAAAECSEPYAMGVGGMASPRTSKTWVMILVELAAILLCTLWFTLVRFHVTITIHVCVRTAESTYQTCTPAGLLREDL